MKRTPRTEWRSAGDEQRMMIWKIVAYDNFYGMCLTVSRKPSEFAPDTFMYFLPDDTDKDAPVMLTFQKRGQMTAQMQFEVVEAKGNILLVTPNILELGYDKVNLFEVHIKSDTAIFNYTTRQGTQRDFKFSLAGFNERYLEQFI